MVYLFSNLGQSAHVFNHFAQKRSTVCSKWTSGASSGLLGLSWVPLGAPLACLGALLVSSWGSLGLSWGPLGVFLGSLGILLGLFGAPERPQSLNIDFRILLRHLPQHTFLTGVPWRPSKDGLEPQSGPQIALLASSWVHCPLRREP